MLNSTLFILMGLQLPAILENPPGVSVTTLALDAALVCLAAVVTRFAWVFPVTYIPRKFSRPPAPAGFLSSLAERYGNRLCRHAGAVSLAAALALSFTLPGRYLIIFLTFSIIFVTLVVQVLTLPPMIR